MCFEEFSQLSLDCLLPLVRLKYSFKIIQFCFRFLPRGVERLLTRKHWREKKGNFILRNSDRINRPDVFCTKGVLRNLKKFTGKYLCQSLFFNKVAEPSLVVASVHKSFIGPHQRTSTSAGIIVTFIKVRIDLIKIWFQHRSAPSQFPSNYIKWSVFTITRETSIFVGFSSFKFYNFTDSREFFGLTLDPFCRRFGEFSIAQKQ